MLGKTEVKGQQKMRWLDGSTDSIDLSLSKFQERQTEGPESPACCSSCVLSRFSHVQLFTTPWIIADQAPLPMGFSKQESGVGLYALLQGLFPAQGKICISYKSPALVRGFFTNSATLVDPFLSQFLSIHQPSGTDLSTLQFMPNSHNNCIRTSIFILQVRKQIWGGF